MKKADEAEMLALRARDPRTWSVADVAKFLDLVGLGEYKVAFIENDVTGAELMELSDGDAQSLGVRKLGHRKQLQHTIRDLSNMGGVGGAGYSDSDSDSASNSSSGHAASSVSTRKSGKVRVKAKWDGAWMALTVDQTIKLADFKRKIKRETRCKVKMEYKDADGDLIEIKRSTHLKTALESVDDKPLRLVLTGEGKGGKESKKSDKKKASALGITDTEKTVFEGLPDTVVVIDQTGKILYVNAVMRKMFSVGGREAVGENVRLLMPESDAASHDFYLWRYMSQRQPRIVGKGSRMVIARRFDGSTFAADLSVSEAKATNGETIFVGTLRMREAAPAASGEGKYAVMDMLQQGVFVINTRGIVQFANKKALEYSGYQRDEIVGHNISMIMPSPYREGHDGYLKHYAETGDAKIIGTGRDVVLRRKDHAVVSVHLTVSVQGSGDDMAFVGVIELNQEAKEAENVLASQRQVLESLAVVAVLIDEKGTVQVFNSAAQKMFGFSPNEVLGRNVNMLMPEPDKSKHDGYLRTYMKKGNKETSKVLGTGRDVVAQRKNGEMVAVHLSVTEHTDDTGKRLFSGIIQPK